MKRALTVLLCALVVGTAPAPSAAAAAYRSCAPVQDPYPGTRYDGVDLSRIRALRARCATARTVARTAHRKALRMTPTAGGIRRFSWNGWKVTGDLRGDRDRYVAARGDRRVRWVF
jgi:hypothetical protein